MKFKYAILLSTLLIIFMLLNGCSKKNNNEIDNGSSNTVKKDDFELTINTRRNVYSIDKLFTTESLNISASVKYIGDNNEITVWHNDPLCSIAIISDNGENVIGGDFNNIKIISILIKDKTDTFDPNFQDENLKKILVKGQYIAKAFLTLSLDEENTQKVNFTAEVPFEIK